MFYNIRIKHITIYSEYEEIDVVMIMYIMEYMLKLKGSYDFFGYIVKYFFEYVQNQIDKLKEMIWWKVWTV